MYLLNKYEISFPDPLLVDDKYEVIAVGGDLSLPRLLFAYQLGIFPWFNPDEEILWWCPNPRFVLFPREIKVSKSMKKIMDRNVFTFSENKCFEEVISNCQMMPREGQDGTWLSDELKTTFIELHRLGYAKSVEVWQNDELVGGFYGMQFGKVFCGESMFSKVSNASKAGFIYFATKNREDLELIDCQYHTDHLESLGARLIPRKDFLNILYQQHESQ
jgi:leucyl/phenylalanyl-tRNA--protein transferase